MATLGEDDGVEIDGGVYRSRGTFSGVYGHCSDMLDVISRAASGLLGA